MHGCCTCKHSDRWRGRNQAWKGARWADTDTGAMEEVTKNFSKEIKALPKGIRNEDCFKVGTSCPNLLCKERCRAFGP
jgi:hypothetical protein